MTAQLLPGNKRDGVLVDKRSEAKSELAGQVTHRVS